MRTKIEETLRALLTNSQDDLSQRLRRLNYGDVILSKEIAILDAHFAAWRASTIKTVDENFEFHVPIAEIPDTLPPRGWTRPADPSPAPPAELKDLWQRFGVGVREAHDRVAGTAEQTGSSGAPEVAQSPAAPPSPDKKQLVTRRPYRMTLHVIEHREDVPVVVKIISNHFVVDERSSVETFELKRSLFGRRSVTLTFDPEGFLTGVGSESSASLASALNAVGDVPGGIATGLETATKLRSGVSAAQRASLEAELSRIKQEVELRQQRLLAAGLNATSEDAAELQRLQQMASIIAAQTTIRGADPSLIAALKEKATDDLTWYQAPTPAPPQEETITVILKREQ